ncbi:MAG: FixH family protein [Anaerolineae bacterium]|nr:FixH family protein [Anaerolineae bacterium]
MRKWTVAGVVLLIVVLAGCRQSPQATSTPDLEITLDTTTPFKMGQTELVVTLKDAQGTPIDNAKIEVQGDMTHAGMKPSLGSVDKGTQGQYKIPFDWSMGGDWVLTIKATLPDGRTASKRIEVTIPTS